MYGLQLKNSDNENLSSLASFGSTNEVVIQLRSRELAKVKLNGSKTNRELLSMFAKSISWSANYLHPRE